MAFERVGAGVEPEDSHVLLDILEVSAGMVSFGAEEDTDGCIAVADLEHGGASYTVRSSRWQWRRNADWPWEDVVDTATSGEVCAHQPARPGHYRLVVEMEVDGETRQHASNTLVEDDHGDSLDDATLLAVPSATSGWLDPDDVDYFRIEAARSGRLTAYTEGWINTEGALLDDDGLTVESDSGDGTDFNFRIERNVPGGTYYVRVHERWGRPGAFTLHADFEVLPPDLVVESVTADASSVDTGASFVLRATVRNRGDGDADATTLRYFRSTDATISVADAEIGTDNVAALRGGASSDEVIEATAPSTPGTYYYGACVDAVADETDANNNCSSAVAEPGANFDLASANSWPHGCVHADGRLYVVDESDDKVYAYRLSGARDAGFDFDLNGDNRFAEGLAYADGTFFVVDDIANQIFVYSIDSSDAD